MSKARKMLSDWKAPYIQSIMKLIETQSKAMLAQTETKQLRFQSSKALWKISMQSNPNTLSN